MPDDKQDQNVGSAEQSKKGGMNSILMIMVMVNTVAVLAIAAYVFMGGGGGGGGGNVAGDDGDMISNEDGQAPLEVAAPEVVDFEPFLVNLNDAGASRYLRASIKVEVLNGKDAEKIRKRMPKVRDLILTYLSSLNLSQTQGTVAKEIIRKQVIRRVNKEMPDIEMKDLYFTEFVTQ